MKKRVLALMLAALMCVATVMTLAACGSHDFKETWEKDDTHHWHACEDADCTEASDKAEHEWDAGEITTAATDTAEGVKTYTCTVCEHTKTEGVAFVGVNLAQYGEAIDAATLNNVTVTSVAVSGNQTVEYIVKLNGNEYSRAGGAAGAEVAEDGEDADTVATLKAAYLFFTQVKHNQLTYDAATKVYTAASDCTVSVADVDDDTLVWVYKSIKMTMSGSRVQTVEAAYDVKESETVISSGTVKLTLSDYGTTAVTQLLSVNDYHDAISASNFSNVTISETIGNTAAVEIYIAGGNMSYGGEFSDDPSTVIGIFDFLASIAPAKYTYDEATDTYVASGLCLEVGGVQYANVKIRLAADDNDAIKLVALEYDVTEAGVTEHCGYTFSAYGTTEAVEAPDIPDPGDGNDPDA